MLGPAAAAVLHQVITREVDGAKMEPYEEAMVEVPAYHSLLLMMMLLLYNSSQAACERHA
jgi:predicted membrane GTPase involved in stress response